MPIHAAGTREAIGQHFLRRRLTVSRNQSVSNCTLMMAAWLPHGYKIEIAPR
jgi:hypothetical protein